MSDTAKPSLHDNDALLTYRVGPVLCCGPTLPVVTIIPPPALTQLPGTNIAEPGIFKYGTYVVSATDLRHRFGVKQENWNQPAKVIIAQHDDLKLTRGYFVDEIKDVISFPEKGWGQLPAHLPRGVFSRTLLLNGHIYLYAEFEKLSQLQGTGYLADYIVHLEKLEEEKKHAVTKSAAKSSIDKQTTSTLKTSEKQIDSKDDKINTSQIKSSSISSSSKAEAETELPIIEEVTSETQIITEPNKFNLDKHNPDKSTPDNPTSNKSNKKLNQSKTKVSEKISETIDKGTIKKSTTNRPLVTSQPTPSKLKVGLKVNNTHDKRNSTENANIKNTIDSLPSKTTTKTDIKSAQEFSSENYPNEKVTAKNKPITPDISKDESSIFPIFIIFLFLFLIAAAVYFVLNHSSGSSSDYLSEFSPAEDEKSLERSYKDTSTTYTDNKTTTLPDTNIITESDDQTKKETITNQSINKVKSSESESNNIGIDVAPLDSNKEESAVNTKDTKNEYHASIQHDDDTITIELDGPLPPQINTNKQNNIDKISSEKSNTIDSSKPENEYQQPSDEIKIVIEPSESKEINTQTSSIPKNIQQDANSFEIVHIIVKGDTLWAIAKHYLLNPYRYPELAKLSKIHNPDLIYPGNRVRIIYKKSSNK